MSNKPSTPVQLPKIHKLRVPQTPERDRRRLLALLRTPELPFTPGLKRQLPDLLRLPTSDPDERGTFLSPGRRLFDDLPNKEELAEISMQLKSKLSLALGKLKGAHAGPRMEMEPALPLKRLRASLPVLQLPRAAERILIPLPDEEFSAHSALLAAFLRLKRRASARLDEKPKLPPISVKDDLEQEAVYLLMLLLLPRKLPTLPTTVLPPIAGLIKNVDNDLTDVELDSS